MPDLRKLVREKIDGLGIKESAIFFGVSIGTISNWSTGKTDPSVDAVERVLMEMEADAPKEDAEWEGKDVVIGLPVYRDFQPDCHFTLFANYAKYGPEKLGLIMEKRTMIYEARNIITHKFLKTGAKKLIMFDSDMVLPCGNAALFNGRYKAGLPESKAGLNTITRLTSHTPEKQIVGVLYFGRHDVGKVQCYKGFHDEAFADEVRENKVNGVFPDKWVATGGIMIHRDVFLAMDPHIDSGKWPECKPVAEDLYRGYWNPVSVGIGEDVSFCRRAGEIGITSYVDADLICLHAGDRLYGPNNTKS
jgi:hypothetical protein